MHDRVRVEQQQVLAARLLGGAVDSGGEAEVLVEREQPDVRELCADHLRGPVAGVVVEHDHLERQAGLLRGERGQAVARGVAAPVGDDEDREVDDSARLRLGLGGAGSDAVARGSSAGAVSDAPSACA